MGTMLEAAAKAVIDLDSRAAEVDLAGRFPKENYELLREIGYLRGPVPAGLGGLDATIVEAAEAQRTLGSACGSTALAVNMHLFQVGAAAEGWRASGANEPALRRIAAEGIVLGSTGAEAIVAGEWDTPTIAVPDGDGYRITGRKYFCSQADVMDVVRVNAKDAETGEILVVAVPASAKGVGIDPTWDTMGMRATASHDLVLDDVEVAASAVSARLPASGPAWDPAFVRAIRWFLALVSGVYVGHCRPSPGRGTCVAGPGQQHVVPGAHPHRGAGGPFGRRPFPGRSCVRGRHRTGRGGRRPCVEHDHRRHHQGGGDRRGRRGRRPRGGPSWRSFLLPQVGVGAVGTRHARRALPPAIGPGVTSDDRHPPA
jgi:hypothetical protein